MPKIFKPGDTPEDRNRPETGKSLGKGPGAKPQMTARVAKKVMEIVNNHIDTKFNSDGVVDEIRAEYDFRVRTAQPMCDSECKKTCAEGNSRVSPFCSWGAYLEANLKTLRWRKAEIVRNRDTLGGQVSSIEIESVHHILDMTISAIEKYKAGGHKSLAAIPMPNLEN